MIDDNRYSYSRWLHDQDYKVIEWPIDGAKMISIRNLSTTFARLENNTE